MVNPVKNRQFRLFWYFCTRYPPAGYYPMVTFPVDKRGSFDKKNRRLHLYLGYIKAGKDGESGKDKTNDHRKSFYYIE
ncbi:hypothetical protein SAMN05421788_113130 [Filimonas lacunae]|uniref:Uncharacterized protein n=1 Tax=Filimonas lacunae TaxID=477680 RepID=A0A1N7RF78_9BACT|nr:hypothetical protein SAMN05421788_113130 [Filimonas lacunae]